ncbi:hypothetical protein Tco_1325604, partial [Tanacetum coccineum]
MADLQFVDQHNMVACLERTNGNAEFHQIVDFLTTSPIHYALTVSPTIYSSYIEQFWATAKSKTVNDVKQIHATVDGKTVVISESSVRSDLHFNDEDGITCLSNDEIFVNLALMGTSYYCYITTQKTHTPRRAKRGRDTKIPQSSGPPKKVGDDTVYTGEDDRVVRVSATATSLEAEQESEVNTSGSGEDSMEHQDDLTDFIAPIPHDSPLLGGHTPGSDMGRSNITELMAICTKLSNRVLALEHSKTAQDLVINKLQKKVKRLEKMQRARTPWMKLFKIGTFRRKSLDKENVSKQGRNLKTRQMFEECDFDDDFDDIDEMVNEAMENVEGDTVNAGGAVNTANTRVSVPNADLTIAQTLVKMRSQKDKEKGVAFRDVEESARSTIILPTIDPKDKGKGIMQEPKKPPKNPRKAQIQMDEELAMRLQEEENVELEKMQRERAAQEEASNAALIAE